MTASWGLIVRLCLVNASIGALAALPVNLFNRLMTVELALPALLPGLLVALHYGVQLSRPVWGHRSDVHGGRTPYILGGLICVALGVIGAAWGIGLAETSLPFALTVWLVSYILIGLGIGAGGTSFLALLASVSGTRKAAAATLAWLFLIIGAIAASIGTGVAIDPYSPARLMQVVPVVCLIAVLVSMIGTLRVERHAGVVIPPKDDRLSVAVAATWADPTARAFTGFVFLSILAFYLSELILEPFAGHIHGLTPDASTKLSGGKDGAALMGMIGAGVLSQLRIGTLRFWAITGCIISAAGLMCLAFGLPLVPSTMTLGLGNGLFVVGAIGSMMQLAAAHESATGTRMGVFGASQAVAAGLAGLIATGTLDVARWQASDQFAYGVVFTFEAFLFIAAALVAARVMRKMPDPSSLNSMVPGE
jgi:BCD family chlorophyll transporter-like MFS transporter